MKSRILAAAAALLLLLSGISPAFAADNEPAQSSTAVSAAVDAEKEAGITSTGRVIEVSLQAGKGKAKSNFKKLEKALKKGGGKTDVTVRIAKSGTYHVHSGGGGALMLRSHTVFDLNGSELVRAGRMTNIIQNCSKNGGRSARRYGLTSHITVMNGTLNGSGGVKSAINLVNIGHASNVKFLNVNFRNSRSHLLEMSGCKDCVIDNCTFSGHKGSKTCEALQLDISKHSWNGVYAKGKGSDCTPCKNVTVSNCTFLNYPSGVGNHHTVRGHHNSNIRIVNNHFTNTGSSKAPAIWCYGFDKSQVSGNTIVGKYKYGIRVSGGSVQITSNTIGSAGKRVNYRAVYVVRAHSQRTSGTSTTTESVIGGKVDQNVVYSSYSKGSIYVAHGSKLNSLSNNSLYTGRKDNLVVEGGSMVGTQTNNIQR